MSGSESSNKTMLGIGENLSKWELNSIFSLNCYLQIAHIFSINKPFQNIGKVGKNGLANNMLETAFNVFRTVAYFGPCVVTSDSSVLIPISYFKGSNLPIDSGVS